MDTKELLNKLEDKLATITENELKALLQAKAKNHHSYSINNLLLAYSQLYTDDKELDFEKLSNLQLAPFPVWTKWNFSIIKGSKSLKILVPIMVNKYEQGKPVLDEKDQPSKYLTFKVGSVFNVTQTTGSNETKEYRQTTGKTQITFNQLVSLVRKAGYKVDFERLPLNKGGYINNSHIVINEANGKEAQFCTLLHELAHATLGHLTDDIPRSIKEIEAECTAYVIGQKLGIDIPSEIYLLAWDADAKLIRKSFTNIDKAVTKINELISQNNQVHETQIRKVA